MTEEEEKRVTALAKYGTSDLRIADILRRLADLEKFRDFAQPIILNASRLWDTIHDREGLRDYFNLNPHHEAPLIALGAALAAQVQPVLDVPPAPEITETQSVL